MERSQRLTGAINLSLTLPLACNICLAKVKEPVVCSNHHVFCTVCLEEWLKVNQQCPTCRAPISNERPYFKLLGGGEDLKEVTYDRSVRNDLRRTRLGLICKEYERDYMSLQSEVDELISSNTVLRKELQQTREQLALTSSPLGDHSYAAVGGIDIEKLSHLTTQLESVTDLYENMKTSLGKLKDENDKLSNENYLLRSEVAYLKRRDRGSPQKFALAALESRLQQRKREEEQLKQALQRSDQYIEQLEAELELSRKTAKNTESKVDFAPQFGSLLGDELADSSKMVTPALFSCLGNVASNSPEKAEQSNPGKRKSSCASITSHFPKRCKSFKLGAVGSFSLQKGARGSFKGGDKHCVQVGGVKKLQWTL
eukprot:m.154261 g.154261  ORF g.154261 m.154261 type:complete len:370 (+) comp38634_c0_seq1:61-1170(+)